MSSVLSAIEGNLIEIVGAIFTSVVTYIGLQLKKIYENYVNDKVKKEIATACVIYVEQLSDSLNLTTSADKFSEAEQRSKEWLNAKGIKVSEAELEILIENAVNLYNKEHKV